MITGTITLDKTTKRAGLINDVTRGAFRLLGNSEAVRIATELNAGIGLPEAQWQALLRRLVPERMR
jgi:hypothetical protein